VDNVAVVDVLLVDVHKHRRTAEVVLPVMCFQVV